MIINLAMNDIFWLGYTLYNECRGEGKEGQIAVAKVILNRLHWAGDGSTVRDIVLKPMQFSCFNRGLRPVVMDIVSFEKMFDIVEEAKMEWEKLDNLSGARFYYNPSVCNPKWAKGMRVVATIGNHIFLKEGI